ncbi:hypothetical protein BGW80DRAFT_1304951 [Lactifluus volemus]|nr:hypothetical protein BGW80DRAFT_1304951 [Lactifluus volemus]
MTLSCSPRRCELLLSEIDYVRDVILRPKYLELFPLTTPWLLSGERKIIRLQVSRNRPQELMLFPTSGLQVVNKWSSTSSCPSFTCAIKTVDFQIRWPSGSISLWDCEDRRGLGSGPYKPEGPCYRVYYGSSLTLSILGRMAHDLDCVWNESSNETTYTGFGWMV